MAPRSAKLIPFVSIPFMAARVLMIDHRGYGMEIVAVGFCIVTIALLMLETLHPRLSLRTKLPQPEIRLNLRYGSE
jgi:hypothetical protein